MDGQHLIRLRSLDVQRSHPRDAVVSDQHVGGFDDHSGATGQSFDGHLVDGRHHLVEVDVTRLLRLQQFLDALDAAVLAVQDLAAVGAQQGRIGLHALGELFLHFGKVASDGRPEGSPAHLTLVEGEVVRLPRIGIGGLFGGGRTGRRARCRRRCRRQSPGRESTLQLQGLLAVLRFPVFEHPLTRGLASQASLAGCFGLRSRQLGADVALPGTGRPQAIGQKSEPDHQGGEQSPNQGDAHALHASSFL